MERRLHRRAWHFDQSDPLSGNLLHLLVSVVAPSRLLCTTALEETWPDDRPVLFLGEWCRRYAQKERWSKLDFAVMPYHWDDRAKYQSDYRRMQMLYERLLPELSGQLNRIHGVNHGTRYWRILVGPWLGMLIHIACDRWTCIQQSVIEFGVSETIVLHGSEQTLVPCEMIDFIRLFTGDEWNHHIYADILLRHFPRVTCRRQERRRIAPDVSHATRALSWKQRSRQVLSVLTHRSSRLFAGDCDAFFLSSYLPFAAEIKLQLRMGQFPQRWHQIAPAKTAVDPDQRKWVLDGHGMSQFENWLCELIPAQIPTVYLEGYRGLIEQVAQLPWPRKPRLIFTSNAAWSDEVFKAWAGEKLAAGTPLIYGQHGGHMGVGRCCFTEDHEVAISDRYLTWGWSDPLHPNITPTCPLTRRKPLGIAHTRQKRALLVIGGNPRFSYAMSSTVVAGQWLDYFEDQCAFIAHLPSRIRGALTVRLYPQDFGWDQAARWGDRMPDVRVEQGKASMEDLIRSSRLYISTYNATTYLESLIMDVPTVIYWNPAYWELRDSAVEFFEALKGVGIFHETPESAARHVAETWDDIGAWWLSPRVREVIERFKFRYCRPVGDVADTVGTVLDQVMYVRKHRTAQ